MRFQCRSRRQQYQQHQQQGWREEEGQRLPLVELLRWWGQGGRKAATLSSRASCRGRITRVARRWGRVRGILLRVNLLMPEPETGLELELALALGVLNGSGNETQGSGSLVR